MRGKMMKNLASGYWKTVVSHGRGCIFQSFQFPQKVEKTTPEIVSKWHQNPLKSGSEGSPKRSLKVQWKIMKNWWKKVSKMRSTKRVFCLILETFLSSGSKGVPGWSQGPSQGPSRVKFAPKWVSKWLQNHQKSYLQAFWKRFSKTRALSMFPNSSGPFFSLFLFMQREILCHIYPSKVPTLIRLARGKNLRWMPPRCLPDASQMPLRCLSDASRCFPDASRCFPKKTVWGLALG